MSRANQINIYDLDAVNTTIVMRELPPNPDLINICMHDLNAVNTDITMWSPCVSVSGGSTVNVFPGVGILTLTGYAPVVTVSSSPASPTNRHTDPSNYFRYAVTRPRGQRIKVVQRFEA